MAIDVTALCCRLDDLCRAFGDWGAHRLTPSRAARQRPGKLSRAETRFIVVLFHLSPPKNLKAFRRHGVGHQRRACFGGRPHHDRFVGLVPRLFAPLVVLSHSGSGEPTGVHFAGPTRRAVGPNRRPHRHRGFDGLAARGKASMGWSHGLKPHPVIHHKGQVLALRTAPGNTADSAVPDEVTRHLAGKPWADKGCVGHEPLERLWRRGPHLTPSVRRNVRNHPTPLADNAMPRTRFLVETALDTLKSETGLEHSRHRSVTNAMAHVLSRLAAYALRPGKPSISLTRHHIEAYP
jgi:hypothetical protein